MIQFSEKMLISKRCITPEPSKLEKVVDPYSGPQKSGCCLAGKIDLIFGGSLSVSNIMK